MKRPGKFLLHLLVAVLCASPAAAQSGAQHASTFIPPQHWSADALRRLDALGWVGALDASGSRSFTTAELARIFAAAGDRAALRAPEVAALARAYHALLIAQFPAAAPADAAAPLRLEISAGAGFEDHDGRLAPGFGPDSLAWQPPIPLDDVSRPLATARLALAGPYAAATVSPLLRGGELALTEGYLVGGWQAIGAWSGRRALGYGPGVGGTLVLAGAHALDGGGVFLRRPVRLPLLGRVRAETSLARVDANGGVPEPWLWSARVSSSPLRSLSLGINRAAMFGKVDGGAPSVRDVLFLMVGKHAGDDGDFENQVVSVDAAYRFRLVAVPLLAYLEWGFEDSAGAFKDVPGVVAGVYSPAFAGVPYVALGVERASFAGSCCGNPEWYRNWRFWHGWTEARAPLGHPLGGHGTQWQIYGDADLLNANLRMKLSAFAREREHENLFAPTRAGSSVGGAIDVSWRAAANFELTAHSSIDDGDGWLERRAYILGRWIR